MFTDRMNDIEKQSLYSEAEQAGELLDSLGYPWWLSHGTLLGAWRHQGVIPWDDDLDIAFPRERVSELEAAATARGWKFRRLGPFLAKIWNPQNAMYRPGTEWTWPFADITLYDETSSTIIVEYMYHRSFAVVDKDLVLPLQKVPFGPLALPVPKSPETLLDHVYPYWRIQPTSSNFNHRTESYYQEPTEKRLIADLAKDFTLFNIGSLAADADSELVVYHGEHPSWTGPVHFYSSGRMGRPGGDEGRFERIGEHGLALFWDRWPPEVLIRENTGSAYRDPTKPFLLHPR